MRGYEYFKYSLAEFLGANETSKGTEALYKVHGGGAYDVTLVNLKDGNVGVSCTCAYFENGNYCKHIWAAALQGDKDNIFKYKKLTTWEDFFKTLPPPAAKNVKTTSETTTQNGPSKKRPRHGIYVIDITASINARKWTLTFYAQEQLQNGTLSKIKKLDLNQDHIQYYPEALDKKALWFFLGRRSTNHYYNFYSSTISSIYLDGLSEVPILQELSAQEKLYFEESFAPLEPLKFINKELFFHLRLVEQDQDYVLSPYFEVVDSTMETATNFTTKSTTVTTSFEASTELSNESQTSPTLTAASLKNEIPFFSNYLFIKPFIYFEKSWMVAHLEDYASWLDLFKLNESLRIPKADIHSFLNTFFALEKKPAIDLPESISNTRIKEYSKVRFLIQQTANSKEYHGDLQFLYGNEFVSISMEQQQFFNLSEKQIFERNLVQELSIYNQLIGSHSELYSNEDKTFYFHSNSLSEIVETLFSLGLEVQLFNKRIQKAGNYKSTISTGVNWFDLNVQFEFDQKNLMNLPQLLHNLQTGERFVTLADGSIGFLSQEWLKKFKHLAQAGSIHGDQLRLTKVQALFLSSDLAEDPHLQSDQKFKTFHNMIASLTHIKETTPSSLFHGQLRSYQKVGLSWLKEMSELGIGSILADDMGLGKTIQILALLADQNRPKALILAPKSLIYNWINEGQKFTPHLKFHNHTGTERHAHSAKLDLAQADVIVTTYHTFRLDLDFFKEINFDFFILDEAHYVKNAESQAYMACRLVNAKYKIALTGTPVENSISDLFSILSIVTPGLISDRLAKRYANERDPEEIRHLSKSLSPFILRRTKDKVLKDLPEKSEQVLYCDLSKEEMAKYKELKEYYWGQLSGKIESKGFSRSKIEILEALLRLRQASCHPGLLNKNLTTASSAKFDVLLEQLKMVIDDGHKALIFSQFTSLLKLLEIHLKDSKITYEYLDGKTNDRQERVENFQQNADVQVFLISLKAGGVGLNLTAAEYVFILDPWWNPAAESQAIDRAHRIGQSKKVFAYKIIAKETVEEKILALQESKKSLAQAVISTNEKSFLKSLNFDDLKELFN